MPAVVLGALLAMPPGSASGKVFSTVEAGLESAFPGCTVERRTVFLSVEQRARAEELAGVSIGSSLVHPYVATCAEGGGGTAYFDAHRVRTLPETLMIVVDRLERAEQIELLSFDEPEEYIPRPIWYRQFELRELDDDLWLGKGIDGVTGATLTARSTTEAVRRILALHRVLAEESR